MLDRSVIVSKEAAGLLGDPHPLTEQLGSASGLTALASGTARSQNRVQDVASLRQFLAEYRAEILVPIELPMILRAFQHASRGETRELIALDRELALEAGLKRFAAASQAVGRSQLRRLLPMRDLRLVRRYWRAVETGEAKAWHVVVYGMVLAVYSLPLRQGLSNYAHQTLAGFIGSAAGSLRLSEAETERVAAEVYATLPAAVDTAIKPHSALRLLGA